MQEAITETEGDIGAASRMLGRRVPRASDERLLRDYAERMERGEATRAGRVT